MRDCDLAVTAFSSVIPNHGVVRNLAFWEKGTASEAKRRPRSDTSASHCEGRSPEAIRRYFFVVASEAKQSEETASETKIRPRSDRGKGANGQGLS